MADNAPLARLGDRSLFPRLQARAYLNHAAVSPMSEAVQATLTRVADSYAERGLHAIMDWIDDREVLRAAIASFIQAKPEDIGFVANTTTGVATIALCLPWSKGDRVVMFSGEFPANVTSWQRAAEVYGLSTTFLPLDDFALGGGPDLTRLEAELRHGDVRLVAVSAVQFQTGMRMPLKALAELCHAHGAQLFVDGIQAVGLVPLDVADLGIDYLTAGSHKWLMAPEGCAFLYAAPHRAAELRRVTAGWLSHAPDGLKFLFDGAGHLRYDRGFKQDMSFVEGGAPNTLGLAGLHTSVNLLAGLGPRAIFDHVSGYLDTLEKGLLDRGFTSRRLPDRARQSGILSVVPPVPTTVVAASKYLNSAGVSVSTPDGHLRFAPHWPNHPDEIPHILDAVDALLKEATS